MIKVTVAALLAVFVVSASASASSAPPAQASAVVSPLAALRDLDGKPFATASAKRLELVVFWATWCDECRSHLGRELTDLNRRPDLAVITVNTDRDESRVRAFLDKEHVALPVLRDPDRALRRELGVFSVPHWALYRRTASGALELVRSQAAFDLDEIRKLVGGARG